jgi:hypothetical protein
MFDLFGADLLDERHISIVRVARPTREYDGQGGYEEIIGNASNLSCDPILFNVNGRATLSVDKDADVEIGDLILIDY